MERVNFLLRLASLNLALVIVFCAFSPFLHARKYVPARQIGVKAGPHKARHRGPLPPGVVHKSRRTMTKTVYRKRPSKHFKKYLVGPYIAGGVGVQMHRHNTTITDATTQEHQADATDQGFAIETALGWSFLFPQHFFIATEVGLTPLPVNTNASISDANTTVEVKGQTGFNLALLAGKHFNGGKGLAYLRMGLEWRKFTVKHQVQDGVNDDIDDNKVVLGLSPGLGLGLLLCDWVYMIAEFRTVFYKQFSFSSPAGGRLRFKNTLPRVDLFLLKFVLPLNYCFGTRYGCG